MQKCKGTEADNFLYLITFDDLVLLVKCCLEIYLGFTGFSTAILYLIYKCLTFQKIY